MERITLVVPYVLYRQGYDISEILMLFYLVFFAESSVSTEEISNTLEMTKQEVTKILKTLADNELIKITFINNSRHIHPTLRGAELWKIV